MKVSKQFLRDFAYIANLYAWTAADIEDAKAQTRASPDELGRYWTRLAAAHRAGYEQTSGNNFTRLAQWSQVRHASAARPELSDQYAHAHEAARHG
jgi:hypothetical protein